MIITLKGKLIPKTIILNPKWKKPKNKKFKSKINKIIIRLTSEGQTPHRITFLQNLFFKLIMILTY